MKIAFVLFEFPKLSETFILNQIEGLIDKGHEVRIIAANKPDNNEEHKIVKEYNLVGKTRYINPPTTYREAALDTPSSILKATKKTNSLLDVLKLFKHFKLAPLKIKALSTYEMGDFDVIHYHFGTAAKRYIHLSEYSDAKIVTSFYGYDASQAPKRKGFEGYEDVFQKSDTITALSQDMSSKLQNLGCLSEKIEKVPLCIDTSKFEPKETENKIPKILTVARFTEKKGLKYAVKALSQIEHDFEYHLVGDGELREDIENQIDEEGLEDQVIFHGWMTNEEVKEKMQESDIFLLPSATASNGDEEGTPTVLLEAQATGLPVVSTYHAGIPEIVEDRETGSLSEEKDVEDLKQNLKSLIDDSDKRKNMGVKGRKYIEQNHSIEKISQRLENIYEK